MEASTTAEVVEESMTGGVGVVGEFMMGGVGVGGRSKLGNCASSDFHTAC